MNAGDSVDTDSPLTAGSAAANDRLGRLGFARAAGAALRSVSCRAGVVLSVEGLWGSGKTSALALIEDELNALPKESRPISVHFNPWLVGDRDALLKSFLAKLRAAVGRADNAEVAQRAAKELQIYATVFEVLKLVPGAGPWATIVEKTLRFVGKSAASISAARAPDLEQQREKVREALSALTQPIVVFIDDIDRLFAQEVFEMVRIIKAVGDLPNVGYIVAWDASYVTDALRSLHVPSPESYPDKIVQVRLALPSMSRMGKQHLMNAALDSLGNDVTKHKFLAKRVDCQRSIGPAFATFLPSLGMWGECSTLYGQSSLH